MLCRYDSEQTSGNGKIQNPNLPVNLIVPASSGRAQLVKERNIRIE
jgi:hypothetical protein